MAKQSAPIAFTRTDGKPETATVRMEKQRDGRPVAVIVTRDGKGKERERRIKYTATLIAGGDWWMVRSTEARAFTDLLKKGFVVAPPQSGPLQMLLRTDVGPPMGNAFAVDEGRGCAWLGDWGALRRVDLATARVESISLGNWRGVRDVVLGSDGVPHVFADFDRASGSSQWRAPSTGPLRLAVLRVRDGVPKVVVEVKFRAFKDAVAVSLSLAADGTMLAPAAAGIGVYKPDGKLQKSFSVAADAEYSFATGAIDPTGRWVAFTRGSGRIGVVDRKQGKETERTGPFEAIGSLGVSPDGTVFVVADDIYVLPARGAARALRIPSFYNCTISADGRTAFTVDDECCAIFDLRTGRRIGRAPIAAFARHATLAGSKTSIYARTDLECFQRLRLPERAKPA